jgi:hypothetical protein
VDGVLAYNSIAFGEDLVTFFKHEFTEGTCNYKYEKVETVHGHYFKLSITGKLPKDYDFRPGSFADMDNIKFFVVTRDHNNRSRLLGYIDYDGVKYGMKYSEDFETGKSGASFNGYDFAFTMNSRFRPRPIEEIQEIPIDPGFPFDPDPDGPGIGIPVDGGEV